jgi:hypothetical protein
LQFCRRQGSFNTIVSLYGIVSEMLLRNHYFRSVVVQ